MIPSVIENSPNVAYLLLEASRTEGVAFGSHFSVTWQRV